MTYDKTQTIEAFLDAAGAKQPTPGGGSVAALAGALSAAMGQMVLNYSIGKKDLAAHQPLLEQLLAELGRARALLLELMIEDQEAFAALSQIRKLPQTDPQRQAKFDTALLVCIRIPQTIGAAGSAILGICQRSTPIANKYLLSDLAVCAELAMATVRSASHNVRINLGDVVDQEERARFAAAAEQEVAESVRIIQRLMPDIWKRIG